MQEPTQVIHLIERLQLPELCFEERLEIAANLKQALSLNLASKLTPCWPSGALLLVARAYLLELPLWFRVRPTLSQGFPQRVAHYPYLVPELSINRNQQGLPSS